MLGQHHPRRPATIARRSAATGRRAAFTIVELLVVIGILSVLAAIALPAVMQARESARRTQCQNNLRNIGVALRHSADARGRHPASGYYADQQGRGVPSHNWVVNLLGFLDRPDLAGKWNFNEPASSPGNSDIAARHLKVLACPADISVVGAGDLSYAVNGGFGATTIWNGVPDCPTDVLGIPVDFNGDGVTCPADPAADSTPKDKALYFATGMFFLENFRTPGTVRHHTVDDVTDGLSQTILVAESARVGFDPFNPAVNWASADAARSSSFLPPGICASNACTAGNVNWSPANSGAYQINSGLARPEGEAPWPNSFHHAGVHILLGDSAVRFLSSLVDGRVYASLLSPQGVRIRGPLAQHVVSDSEF
jgi:prepilin-type N-terminal cleavage/methylation domain-containing protein